MTDKIGADGLTDAQRAEKARLGNPSSAALRASDQAQAERDSRLNEANRRGPGDYPGKPQVGSSAEAEKAKLDAQNAQNAGRPATTPSQRANPAQATDPSAEAEAARLAGLTPGERKAQIEGNPHGQSQGLGSPSPRRP